MSENEWKYIDNYDVSDYKCGLRAGDKIRLIAPIYVRTVEGNLTGEVHEVGEVWTVLRGSSEDPMTVWLSQPDGKPHTWSDDDSIYKNFEKIHNSL